MTRSRSLLVSVLHSSDAVWGRDSARDVLVWPGQTVAISATARQVDHRGPAPSSTVCKERALGGRHSYSRLGCRNTVMQMIAEKSVNCSLMSLPPSPGSDLPTCGPLEGLALMYILKVGCRAAQDGKIKSAPQEQGDLVVQNPSIRNKFERNLMEKCPYECELKYWRSEVISSEVEEKVS